MSIGWSSLHSRPFRLILRAACIIRTIHVLCTHSVFSATQPQSLSLLDVMRSYYRGPQQQRTLCRYNGQSIRPVVVNQMTDALEHSVLGPHLKRSTGCIIYRCATKQQPSSIPLTIPSGSISNRCLGDVVCMPLSTYWPGVPCDSRTKKSPSFFSSASDTGRLIPPWYHDSVIICDFWTSADSENGSAKWRS